MAFAASPVEPKRRPTVVTVACWLLYLAAAAQVLTAVITLSQLGTTKQAYSKLFADTSMQGAENMIVAITAATAVGFGLLFAVGYILLGVFNGRGKNPARIVTWVVAGLAICYSGCGLVSTAAGFTGLTGNSTTKNAPSAEEIQKALNDALPGWYQPVITAVNVVSLAALVTTVVLLALPIANDFFRKRPEPGWEQSVPAVPPPTA